MTFYRIPSRYNYYKHILEILTVHMVLGHVDYNNFVPCDGKALEIIL